MTVRDYAETWLAHGTRELRPRTRAYYRRWLLHHLIPQLPAGGALPLRDLQRLDVRTALLALRDAGTGQGTIRNAWIALCSCLSSAVEDGLLAENVAHGAARRLFRKQKLAGKARAMNENELARFFRVAQTSPLADLFLTVATTGIRLGEALGLRPEDVELDALRLRIARTYTAGTIGPTKGGIVRHVALSRHLAHILADRMARQRAEWLFPSARLRGRKPWHASYVEDEMARVCARAGLRRFTPHALRHAWSVFTLEATGDLVYCQRQLGHASIAITADLYGETADPKRPDAPELLDRAIRRPPLAHPTLLRRPWRTRTG